MRLSLFALILFVAALVSAGHFDAIPRKIKESVGGPPRSWVKQGPAPSDHLIQLRIALTQPYIHILENHLLEVSDPKHERYGAYLTKEETEALMAPHPEALDTVSDWLSSHGIEEDHLYRSSAQDWVTAYVPVFLAEEMLNTRYDVYAHSDSGERLVRAISYSLPENLHGHIELIQPTTMFTRLKPLTSTLHWATGVSVGSSNTSSGTLTGPAGNPVDASCNGTTTITCLEQLYNAVGYNTSATNGNKIAVTNYPTEFVNNRDLQQFFQLQNPAAYGSNYTFVSINGAVDNQSYAAAGVEANLDTQFAFGLTYPTPAIFYSTDGLPPFIPDAITPTNTNEPFLDWLDFVSSQDKPPQTISTSYADDEQTVPMNYAKRVCSGFAALGARGVSLLFGSGDGAVGGGNSMSDAQPCLANDGTNRTVFIPQFPASCPFVTSVGGTNFIPETAVYFSGGGFSNYFPRPRYQDAAVSKYLTMLAPGTYEGLYNPNGRGIPDVAAQGRGYQIIYQGQQASVDGTSCAAPAFASFISMLSDARLSAHKPPLGFLNPWLYQRGYAGLNDIMIGKNPACGTEGFNATVGWDPITGFGTPNFKKLLDLVMTV